MKRFVQKSGDPVAINPALVRKVRAGADGTTVISFDKEDQVWVQLSLEEVVRILEAPGKMVAEEGLEPPTRGL